MAKGKAKARQGSRKRIRQALAKSDIKFLGSGRLAGIAKDHASRVLRKKACNQLHDD